MAMYKLFRMPELAFIRSERDNVPFVLATGCFDILHRGHVELLIRCREIADSGARGPGNVAVGLNSDRAVKMLKGESRPIHCYSDRAYVMAGLEMVDFVFEIDDMRVAETIRQLRPTIWVKGGDYTIDTLDKGEVAAADEVGTSIQFVPAVAGYSTTSILSKL